MSFNHVIKFRNKYFNANVLLGAVLVNEKCMQVLLMFMVRSLCNRTNIAVEMRNCVLSSTIISFYAEVVSFS